LKSVPEYRSFSLLLTVKTFVLHRILVLYYGPKTGNHRVFCRWCREITYYVGKTEGTLDEIKLYTEGRTQTRPVRWTDSPAADIFAPACAMIPTTPVLHLASKLPAHTGAILLRSNSTCQLAHNSILVEEVELVYPE